MKRLYAVNVAKGDWGKDQHTKRLPRVQARCYARRQIRQTSPNSRWQGVDVVAPGGVDEMPELLGWYRGEIRRSWDRCVAI